MTNTAPAWDKMSLLQSALFAPLHPLFPPLAEGGFPTLDALNTLLDRSPVTVQSGKPLRFVAQDYGKKPFESGYEPRCYLAGEVQTRGNNWHDLFNALVWLSFPKSKAAINARHFHAQTEASQAAGGQRGPARDALTLLDESGVLIPCADPALASLLRDFKWRELFWDAREAVKTKMGFWLFGHSLYEKALRPYTGLTGHGLILDVEPDFFTLPFAAQLQALDARLAAALDAPERLQHTHELNPVPLLGVPGFCIDNENAAYYANTAYFRPGRRIRA